jgi:hypothetical protein
LLQAEADSALVLVDVENDDFHLLTGGHDFTGMHVLLCPAHLGDVHQTFDTRLQFDERAVIGDVGYTAQELGADRVL